MSLSGGFRQCNEGYGRYPDSPGILAVVRQKHYRLEEILSGNPACLMILETIQDPGNLGTILRAGEGAGVTGIIMDKNTVDIYNPKVIRSTIRILYFEMPLLCQGFSRNLKEGKGRGDSPVCRPFRRKTGLRPGGFYKKLRFIIGNEANGLKARDGGSLPTPISGFPCWKGRVLQTLPWQLRF